jgi:hypothetical protein
VCSFLGRMEIMIRPRTSEMWCNAMWFTACLTRDGNPNQQCDPSSGELLHVWGGELLFIIRSSSLAPALLLYSRTIEASCFKELCQIVGFSQSTLLHPFAMSASQRGPARRGPSGAWSRLKPAVIDPLEVYGLPSKGETRCTLNVLAVTEP